MDYITVVHTAEAITAALTDLVVRMVDSVAHMALVGNILRTLEGTANSADYQMPVEFRMARATQTAAVELLTMQVQMDTELAEDIPVESAADTTEGLVVVTVEDMVTPTARDLVAVTTRDSVVDLFPAEAAELAMDMPCVQTTILENRFFNLSLASMININIICLQ